MSIKFKLVLFIVLTILLSSIPLSIVILNRQKHEKIESVIHEGEITTRVLAHYTLNVLLMNGADINTSRVDAKEMISILSPLRTRGLVYADAILLSSDEKLNGTVLASVSSSEAARRLFGESERLVAYQIEDIKTINGYREISIPGAGGTFYEIVSFGRLPGKAPFCMGRIFYSKSAIVAPIEKTQRYVFVIILATVFVLCAIGYFFSGLFVRPLARMIDAVMKIEAGDLSGSVPVAGRDELGRLADSFNRMAKNLDLKIGELEAMNIELERLDDLKDEFLANTSHELRTPISGIVGIAESMIDGAAGALDEQALYNLSLIASSGRRLSNLINDILDFSRLKNEDIVLKLKAVDLVSTVDSAVSVLLPLAAQKNLRIKNFILDIPLFVYADEDRLQQVLVNLIGNAIKFTEAGEIVIRTEKKPTSPAMLTVSVSDTGIGIPEQMIGRIFDYFVQADGSVSRRYGGTGLGLSITRKLVELHGGSIRVESKEGSGSTFYFTIPLWNSSMPSGDEMLPVAPPKVFREEPDQRSGHAAPVPPTRTDPAEVAAQVLVVDDEPVNLQVLLNHLGLAGYYTEVAASGAEALTRIEKNGPPDLVLLDVMMPVMSGFEVCRRIRELYSPLQLPVIMLTAKKTPLDIITGLEMGANDYISKPFDRQELLARVRNFIALKRGVAMQNELMLIQRELSVARNIQQSIIPETLPDVPGLELHARYCPMRQVGGDFYDFYRMGDAGLGVIIGDVSGHGMPAALIGSMFKIAFSIFKNEPDVSVSLARINSALIDHVGRQFITANYMVIDARARTLVSSNAGHWPQIMRRALDGSLVEIYNRNKAIGIVPDIEFSRTEYAIGPGDRIVLFTDGVIEAMNGHGELFGEERFKEIIRECGEENAEFFFDRVFDELHSWTGIKRGESFEDDICLLCIDVK